MIRFDKCFLAIASAALLAGIAPISQAAPRVSDFALLDQRGDFFQLSYYADAKAVILTVFPPNEDKALIERYQAIAAKYGSDKLVFAAVRIGAVDDRVALAKRLSDAGATLPVLLDDSESVAESLSLTRAGESLLLDPKAKTVLFRGPVGPELIKAVEQRIADATIEPASVAVPGAELPLSDSRRSWRNPKDVSYSKDIVPLLSKHCVGCHRAGGIAPFAMDSWGVVMGWSTMIREVILTKRMPPGQADPAVGNLKNSRALSSQEIATITRWIDAGAPRDGNQDPLEIAQPDEQWAFGKPDHIVELPAQKVPDFGIPNSTEQVLSFGLPKDKWIRASQFMPGDKRVLHHAELFIAPARSTGISPGEGSRATLPPYYGVSDPDVATFASFVPGDEPTAAPANTGGVIRKDAELVVQLHYATIGREVEDKSRLALWFHDDAAPPQDRMAVECACAEPAKWQAIPPRIADFRTQATFVLKKAAYLYSVQPRMHYRGSAIRVDAEYASGSVEPLLNVPRYSYNWQSNYRLLAPKLLPAGTRIIASARYDNSARNSLNPDPSQEVIWGREGSNEELAVVLQLQYVR